MKRFSLLLLLAFATPVVAQDKPKYATGYKPLPPAKKAALHAERFRKHGNSSDDMLPRRPANSQPYCRLGHAVFDSEFAECRSTGCVSPSGFSHNLVCESGLAVPFSLGLCPVVGHVRRVGFLRVPPKVVEASVRSGLVGKVAGLHAFRAGADERLKDQLVDLAGDYASIVSYKADLEVAHAGNESLELAPVVGHSALALHSTGPDGAVTADLVAGESRDVCVAEGRIVLRHESLL